MIVERARALGRDVRVALAAGAEGTDEYATHLADLHLESLLTASSSDLTELAALARRASADVVVVPDGDRVALALGKGGRWGSDAALSVLVIRATAQPGPIPVLDPVRKLARRTLLLAASVRPRVRVRILRSGWRAPRSLIPTVGEPVSISASPDDRVAIRKAHGLDEERYWFGILGAVNGRKNPDLVARALLAQQDRSVGLLVAGRIDAPSLARLQDLAPQFSAAGMELRIVDRFLSNTELDEYVVACDCLVFAHSNEGPSANFGKALLAGTRVLAAGARSLRADASAVASHASWAPLDVSALATAMAAARTARRPEPLALPGPEALVDALL